MNTDLQHLIALFGSKGLRALIILLVTAVLARILGPAGMGQYAMLVAAATLLHSVFLGWMHAPHIRFGREEWIRRKTLSDTWASRWPLLLPGMAIAAVLVLANPYDWIGRIVGLPADSRILVLVSLAGLWMSMECQSLLQARGDLWKLALAPLLVDAVTLLLLAALLALPKDAAQRFAVPVLLTWAAMAWAVILYWQRRWAAIKWLAPRPEHIVRTVCYAWPLLPGFLLGYVSDWGDQFFLQYFFSSREVGLFQAAYQFLVFMLGLSAPLGTILLSRLIEKNIGSPDIGKVFTSSIAPTLITLWAFCIFPVVALAPGLFSMLMGEGFHDALRVFVLLSVSIPGAIFSSLYGVLFSLQGRLWRSTIIYVGAMSAINVGLSLLLVPAHGPAGAAIATSVSYLFVQCCYLIDQHTHHELGLHKIIVLYVVILAYGVIQSLLLWAVARIALCIFAVMMLVAASRQFSLIEPYCVARIFTGRMEWIGAFVLRAAGASGTALNKT